MTNKFVIGIGSQRAGSTLLHKILDECTDIFMHPVKELHYFDTLYKVRHQDVLTKFSKRQLDHILERIIKAPSHNFIDKRFKCNLRANNLLANRTIEEIEYLDLYRPCISENEYLGEITPEYMILPEEGIKKMREDLGEDTKIILIARDPVKRFISAFKLLKMYGNNSYDMVNFQKDLEDTIANSPAWMKLQDQLNNYEISLNNYKKYFKNILFLSYEQIVSDRNIVYKQLENFLDVFINKDKFNQILGTKVNSIGETGNISADLVAVLKARYVKEVKFLDDYFNKDRSHD